MIYCNFALLGRGVG